MILTHEGISSSVRLQICITFTAAFCVTYCCALLLVRFFNRTIFSARPRKNERQLQNKATVRIEIVAKSEKPETTTTTVTTAPHGEPPMPPNANKECLKQEGLTRSVSPNPSHSVIVRGQSQNESAIKLPSQILPLAQSKTTLDCQLKREDVNPDYHWTIVDKSELECLKEHPFKRTICAIIFHFINQKK